MTISGFTRIAGVFGWPVHHSRSPLMHNYWLERLAIDGAYVPLAVAPDDFDEALHCLGKYGFVGANVTVPHKQAALSGVDHADNAARRIGAVNMIVVDKAGKLHGSNTDSHGFMANLTAGAPAWRPDSAPAAVVGAGGAARAVVVALIDAGVPEIRVVNRSRARAETLAGDMDDAGLRLIDWSDRGHALVDAGLLVNATSAGLDGAAPLDLDLTGLPHDAVVTDLVYDPVITPVLERAQARGNPIVDGLGMLIHQAIPGFTAWFGGVPKATAALRKLLERDLARRRRA